MKTDIHGGNQLTGVSRICPHQRYDREQKNREAREHPQEHFQDNEQPESDTFQEDPEPAENSGNRQILSAKPFQRPMGHTDGKDRRNQPGDGTQNQHGDDS